MITNRCAFDTSHMPFYQHKVTGGLYRRVTNALMEADLSEVVIYTTPDFSQTWVRPLAEFNERFELYRGGMMAQ